MSLLPVTSYGINTAVGLNAAIERERFGIECDKLWFVWGEGMKFGWINLLGGVFVILLLIPNIVYAIKNRDQKNLCDNKAMNAIEQIGRYACIVLMWFPLFVWEFGFGSVFKMVLYVAGNVALMTAYWILFAVYMRRKTYALALALAIIPSCIFLFSGVLLRHWSLVCFAVLFAVGHIYVTIKNAEKEYVQ